MVIDCETHIFKFINMKDGYYERTHVEDLIEDMDRCGVDKSFLMYYTSSMLSHPGSQFPEFPGQKDNVFAENDEEHTKYFIESWQRYKDRFFFFDITDPRQPDCIERLERQYKLGLQGLGETQPGYQYLMPNSPEFKQIYRFAAHRGLPVVLTAEGWDQFSGYFPAADWNDYFDMLEEVIREFRDVRFMLGHGGNCGSIVYTKDWDEYLEANERCYRLVTEVNNLWIACCMPWWIRDDKINSLLSRLVEFLRDNVGFERVSWGSDWPWVNANISFNSRYDTVVDFYRNFAGCTEDEVSMLLGNSAYEFLTGNAV